MALLAASLLLGLGPATAKGADTFVDQTRPDDSGDCLTPASACKTIGGALGKAGASDTVFVVAPAAQTTYAENVFLTGGKSLVALHANPSFTIIDNGTGMGTTPAVYIPPPPTGAAGGAIEGFTIRSDFRALHAQAPVTVEGNFFDEGTPPNGPLAQDVQIDTSADGSLITGNGFVDPTPTAGENQIGINLSGSSTVSNNGFDDMVVAILAGGGSSAVHTISGNEITGARVGNGAGAGISVSSGNPTIVGNFVHEPFFALPGDTITGIGLNDIGGNLVGATLRRNTVTEHRWGVLVDDVNGPVTLDSDLLAMNRHAGLRQFDSAADDPGIADVTATNLTVFDTADPNVAFEQEIVMANANLILDSSIIGATGIDNSGSAVCSISFSRGIADGIGDPSCDNFQSIANPMFVGGGDYHLTVGSPMIDAGNPAAPSPQSLDIDGLARAVNGNGVCPAERDMGTDEFVPGMPVSCTPPATTPIQLTPAQPVAPRKCKKGRKLKKGKCVKKKRKKRR